MTEQVFMHLALVGGITKDILEPTKAEFITTLFHSAKEESELDAAVVVAIFCLGGKKDDPGVYVYTTKGAADNWSTACLFHRYLLGPGVAAKDVDPLAVTQDLQFNVLGRDFEYVSTRGCTKADAPYRFLDVIREGLANDGGLFMPKQLPTLPAALLKRLATDETAAYIDTAQLVLERLADPGMLSPKELNEFLKNAYADERWTSSKGVVCPVVKVNSGAEGTGIDVPFYMLELFHGPTAAFKDFALQLFPYLFQKAISKEENRYVILAATSGDTGVAVIEGVRLSQAPNLKVMVLYPNQGVSPVQKIQMVGADGPKVRVVGVESDFDFCQSTVKSIFNNDDVNKELKSKHKVVLSSANSINWGRLVPQIVYYFFGYGELVRKHNLTYGQPIDVCVPTGNFGNILSCFVAKRMGLPVRRFLLASNENDVLFEFVRTGVYDIKQRSLVPTESPSIDILRASNIERLLYLLSNGDQAFVKKMMDGLNGPDKKFEVTDAMKEELKSSFWSMRCDRAQCAKTIGEVYNATKTRPEGHYLLDPHTAVAFYAAQKYRLAEVKEKKFGSETPIPILIASTAHWAKFPPAVMEALKMEGAAAKAGCSAASYQIQDSVNQVKDWYSTIGASSKASHCSGSIAVEAAIPLAEMINSGKQSETPARVSEADLKKLTDAVLEFSA